MKITIYHRESGKIIEDALLQYKNNKYVLKVDGVVYRLSENDPRKRLDDLFIDCLFAKDYVVFFNERIVRFTYLNYETYQPISENDRKYFAEFIQNRKHQNDDTSEFIGNQKYTSVWKYCNRDIKRLNQDYVNLYNFIKNKLRKTLTHGDSVKIGLEHGEELFLELVRLTDIDNYKEELHYADSMGRFLFGESIRHFFGGY